ICCPLPDVSDHVEETVTIRRKLTHRRRSLIPIVKKVLPRKFPLPGIGHLMAAGCELLPPGKGSTIKTAARCKLPLGLRGQFLARPFRVSLSIFVGDVHDGMLAAIGNRTSWPLRMAPIRTRNVAPPVVDIP